jgi:hypothetical protein
MFFGIQDDGKSPEKFEFCTTYTIVRILSSQTYTDVQMYGGIRVRAHQGNRQLQCNSNFREKSLISSRQLVSRLAGTH